METKAEPRNEKGQTLAEFLAAYDENKYRRPSATVDMVGMKPSPAARP
ncbi:hydrolase NUDIX family [Clostridium sp. CAG:226]|nr:hydrolase NUDIX family [Clostridium sp. CAG:226]